VAKSCPSLPELGVGITYSSSIEPAIKQWPELFDVVEFEPQTSWVETGNGEQPYRVSDAVLDHIAQLPGRKLVHSIGVPVGGTVRPQPAQLALLRRTIAKFNSPWVSEHLSFNRTQEFSTGFFLPPRQTPQGVEIATTCIRDLQAALPVPIAVETGVNYLRPRHDEMPDGAFVAAVSETADCGILLDLHNLFANGVNGRQTVEEFIAQLPLERIWEIHLAGGFEMEGFWLDAHSGAIPDPLLNIARQVVPALPNLKAIVFELFSSFVPDFGVDGIRREIEKLHELWELRRSRCHESVHADLAWKASLEASECASPATWERALGSLVIGRPPDDEVMHELANDPGVALINHLACEFRASMIVSVLRLTSRLLMLALGPDIFRSFLEAFWSKTPPQLFASSEAEAFATYLEALDLKVPQLKKVLEFERAVMATLMDDAPRVVSFDFDPLPLLRGLAEGRLTNETGRLGRFEIEVTGDGLLNAPALGLDSLQRVVPFH
jgi:uncharacterized protein (UPF0276 family)